MMLRRNVQFSMINAQCSIECTKVEDAGEIGELLYV